MFSCDFGPRNGAENVTLYNVLSCFLTKKSYDKFSEKLIGMQNKTKMPKAIFSHLDNLLDGHMSQKVKFTVLGQFSLMGIVQKPTVRSYFSKSRVT